MSLRSRYLLLLALRWLPTGLLIPISVLLPLDRGLSLAQVGSVAAAQGIVVLVLQLPTGGLTDALGRRPMHLLSAGFCLLAYGVLAVAHSVPAFLLYWVLQGVFRALDSGPLDSWYVDQALAANPGADIETDLSRSGVVLGSAVAGGVLLGGGLVGLTGSLGAPVLVAFVLQVISVAGILVLMREQRAARGRAALWTAVRDVPSVVGGALRLVRGSRAVAALVGVEFLWSFGMPAFEQLMPVRLKDLLESSDRASALMGPVGCAAWGASALGAALIPLLTRRAGARWSGFTLRLAQGATVVGMALIAGPAGVIAAFLLCYAVHGAANPVHSALLHRQVDGSHRASLISLNSMAGQPGNSLGMIVLTAVAGSAGTPAAMLIGAGALAAAAPLYLVRDRVRKVSLPVVAVRV